MLFRSHYNDKIVGIHNECGVKDTKTINIGVVSVSFLIVIIRVSLLIMIQIDQR